MRRRTINLIGFIIASAFAVFKAEWEKLVTNTFRSCRFRKVAQVEIGFR